MTEKLKCALIYDFDGTLAEGDCPADARIGYQ